VGVQELHGEYSINGGAFTTAAGTVRAGDQVRVQHTSAVAGLSAMDTTLTVGGVSATFRSRTGSADTTPAGFAFVDVTGARRGKQVTSYAVYPADFNTPVAITLSGAGAQYQLNNVGWTSAAGTVRPGDRVTLRLTASATANATVSTTVTVGGVSDTWNVTSGTK
jgi:hypothetical protein